MEKKYQRFIDKLEQTAISVDGLTTAVYHRDDNHEQTFLLVHGGGGDFHGMIPLAYELRRSANIVLVDLPSHGRSEIVKPLNLEKLQRWSRQLLPSLQRHGLMIDMVVAHSFGCVPASHMNCQKVWYINPPLEVPVSMKIATAILHAVRHIVQFFYLNYQFSVMRGVMMLHNKRDEVARSMVAWLTRQTRTSRANMIVYSEVIYEATLRYALTIPDSKFTGIISSKYDNIARPVSKDSVKCDVFAEIESGHLSVIENPVELARIIS